MTSEEIIKVIDALCEKLGLAASSISELVPKLAQWKIGLATLGIFVALLIFVAGLILTVYGLRNGKKDDTYYSLAICGGCVVCASLAVIVFNAVNLLGWVMAPDIKAVEYILQLVS